VNLEFGESLRESLRQCRQAGRERERVLAGEIEWNLRSYAVSKDITELETLSRKKAKNLSLI
jgi:hypothetical protein